jgi:hypothetical protein
LGERIAKNRPAATGRGQDFSENDRELAPVVKIKKKSLGWRLNIY